MVDEIKNFGESVGETASENLDPKAEIRLGASENIATSLQHEKSDTKEAKETFVKSLEFEPDTFKIDSTGWKEVTRADRDDPTLGKFTFEVGIVKVNATCDVVEFIKGPAKGEQLFITYDAFIREVMKAKNCTQEEVETKYLMTTSEFKQKMKGKPNRSEEYVRFFDKEIKGHLAGIWNPHIYEFYNVGGCSNVWLSGGDNAYFYGNAWERGNAHRDYGFSGRLLKN